MAFFIIFLFISITEKLKITTVELRKFVSEKAVVKGKKYIFETNLLVQTTKMMNSFMMIILVIKKTRCGFWFMSDLHQNVIETVVRVTFFMFGPIISVRICSGKVTNCSPRYG